MTFSHSRECENVEIYMDIKIIFGGLAIFLNLIPFAFYFYGIWKGNVKPHVLSWFTWSMLTGVGFLVSILNNGGLGSWVFCVSSLLCLAVAIAAIFYGEKNIKRLDWVTFLGAIVILIFYILTNNSILTAIFAATIDTLGFIPTFRKSILKPYEEPYSMYIFSFFAFILSLVALNEYNFSTVFYPSILIVTNLSFVVFLFIRRKIYN